MGNAVRAAQLIAIADTTPSQEAPYSTVLTLREIIKGDADQRGQSLLIKPGLSSAAVWVPREAKSIAVLLGKEWQSNPHPVLEVYQKPQEIEALRVFVRVYDLPTERARLEALRERRNDKNTLFRQQLLRDLGEMRQKENFPILTALFTGGDEALQRAVIDLIGSIGDVRGVPTLIAALESPHHWVAVEASTKLRFYFPGAPGVTEAFRRALNHKHLESAATAYLMKYDAALNARLQAQHSPYQRLNERLEQGNEAGAGQLLLSMLEEKEQAEYVLRFNTDGLVSFIETRRQDADRSRLALLPLVTRDTQDGDYLQAIAAAKVLRALHHPDTVAPLLRLLGKKDNGLYEASTRIAAFALVELGEEQKQAAIEQLSTRSDWPMLRPVFALAGEPNEARQLLELLPNMAAAGNNRISLNWLLYRLGELRNPQAVPALVEQLSGNPAADSSVVTQALIRIGGATVGEAVTPLLQSKNDSARTSATQILFTLQKERFLPLLRRMLREDDLGVRGTAAMYLSRIGTPQDLEVLVPLSDFWTGDRTNHYWLMSAITEIRERYNYDLNGPITRK
jgi:HEAT repeat protein